MIYVSSITLNKTRIVVQKDHEYILEATVLPENATNKNLKWTTTDSSVATVSNGKVTGIKAGSAYICAEATDGSYESTPCYVEVTNDVLVTNIELNASALNMSVGDGFMLVETIKPTNATNCRLSWSSSDYRVATVDPEDGFVMARGVGSAVIEAMAIDGSGVFAECAVTVDTPVPVTGIEICPEKVSLSVDDTYELVPQFKPSNASDRGIIWESSNTDVASIGVYSGKITAHSAGTTTITATTHDGGFVASREVKVKETVTIQKDGFFSNVIFDNGTIWKCNEYTCDANRNSYTPFDHERSRHNASIDFSTKQLGFLFKIDPRGVIYYVENKRLAGDTSPTDYLIYRDNIFEEIYGKKPIYFTYENSQLYYHREVNENNRYYVYSEAELIFGMLPRWTLQNVVETLFEAAVAIMSAYIPMVGIAALTFDIVACFFYTKPFTEFVGDEVNGLLIDALQGSDEVLNKIFGWASSIVDLFFSLVEDVLPPEIDNVQVAVYENASKNDSYVIKVSDGNEKVGLIEFIEHYKSLIPN